MPVNSLENVKLTRVLIQDLFRKQRESLDFFFDKVDSEDFITLVEEISKLEGTLFITGVGKSGFISQKIAATLVSTGTKSQYLSPLDLLHGDIGVVTQKDKVMVLSKSGESEELLEIVPPLRNKGAEIISIVCKENSRLEKISDRSFFLPLNQEVCPFNLSPTTSPALQLLFGDTLSVALMIEKGFTEREYAGNHPAGRIGKKMTLKVADLMLAGDQIPRGKKEDRIVDSLVELSNKQCGCLLILNDQGELEGIFTDGDLRRVLQKHQGDAMSLKLEEVMTHNPRMIAPSLMADKAIEEMEANPKSPITVLPVVQDRKVVGLIKLHDLLQSGL